VTAAELVDVVLGHSALLVKAERRPVSLPNPCPVSLKKSTSPKHFPVS